MNITDLFRLARRRWYVFVAGLLVAGVAFVTLTGEPGVHIAVAEIEFAPPAVVTSFSSPRYGDTIAFTGAVERAYNDRYPSIKLSSPTATLFGNGVRKGLSVAASRSGGQWQIGQDRPVIVVSVSASDETEASTTLHEAITRIGMITVQLQDDAGVAPSHRITAQWNEREFATDAYGRSRGSNVKGAGAMGATALVASVLLAAGLDDLTATRGRRRVELRLPLPAVPTKPV